MGSVRQIILNVLLNVTIVGLILAGIGKWWLERGLRKHNEKLETLRAGYSRELETYKSDLENSKRLLQGEIDRTILVTKVHFETEFNALKTAWAKLAEIRLQMGGLRPPFSVEPANDTREAKLKRLSDAVAKIQTAYNELIETAESQIPFYPQEIYDRIGECQQAAFMEITDALIDQNPFSLDWFRRGQANLDRYIAAYRAVAELIRTRIGKLAIVRGT